MPEFEVDLFDPPHGVRRLRVAAADTRAVAAALGVPPARLLDVRAAGAPAAPARPRRVRAIDLRAFCQELALLLDAGVPLLEAMQTLAERDAARPLLQPVIDALREGQPLSQALALEPGTFDDLLRAIVMASERSGLLAASLQRHADYLAWVAMLRSRVVAAALYPALLLIAGLGVVVFLLLYVLPRFAGVFEGLGDQVPAASRALIALGSSLAAHPWIVPFVAALATVSAVAAWRSAAVRAVLVGLVWRWPVVERRWRVVALARLYRGLAVLAQAGVPLPRALRLAQAMLPAPLRAPLAAAIADVEAGQRLSGALQVHGLATPAALRMTRVGEAAGELPLMLERAAAFHDDEVARLADLATRAVNPILMLVMGVVIGGIVVAMYLPIFTLMEQVR